MIAAILEMIEETAITPELDQAIRHTLCASFPNDDGNFSLTRKWHGSGPEYTVLMQSERKVIAHVGVVDRQIDIGGVPLHVAGVQNVCVLPDWRGKGLSDRVMIAAMQEAETRGYDCGLLFCIPVLEKVYARVGWISLGVRDVIRTENGQDLPIPDKNIAMYYPIKVKSLPEGIIHLRGNDW